MEWLKESEYLLRSPKTSRGLATLEKICEEAVGIFYEKGFNDTSVVDITSAAGIATGTFFIYFDSKLSLFKYLLKSYHRDIRKNIQIKVADLKTREEQEEAGLRYWFEYVAEHRFVFNIAWESFFIDKSIYDEYYSSFSESYINRLVPYQEKGEVAAIDPEVLSFILMGISNFLAAHWIVYKQEKDFDHVVKETMKFLKSGMFI